MSSHDRSRTSQIYQEALARSGTDRVSFVIEACNGDEALRRRVELLLANPGASDDFIAARRRNRGE